MAGPTEQKTLDYQSPTRAVPSSGAALFESPFLELEATEEVEALTLSHRSEEGVVPGIVLGVSTALFILFDIVVLPKLHVTRGAAVMWLVVGLAVLAAIGFAMQLRVRSTRVRIDAVGLTIDQGTPIDREHIAIEWSEVAGVLLEPVDVQRADGGMMLRILAKTGEPIDTLMDVPIGDLTAARQTILARWSAHRAKPPSPKADAARSARAGDTESIHNDAPG